MNRQPEGRQRPRGITSISKTSIITLVLGATTVLLALLALALERYLSRGAYDPLDVLVLLLEGLVIVQCVSCCLATIFVAIVALALLPRHRRMVGKMAGSLALTLTGLLLGCLPPLVVAIGTLIMRS
ncbi:hypothetical protein PT282_05840 [Bifidobacterium sp. ESL0763]|uniref:hypothetical protein n=1 Tax=Bifidobacterium sp. ESL0763 TaxID=2983227 RepID=UPI0023F88476|nr:hypothetical protein [Bifidobacterium sp. ESL0763]MDF7664181.1 hypothetical protein [Bifidobacterium sp. ESL0763]